MAVVKAGARCAAAVIAVGLVLGGCVSADAQTSSQRQSVIERVVGVLTGKPGRGPVTQREAEQGMRAALGAAADAAAVRLGAVDGFWGAPQFKLILPGALGAAQIRLRAFGMAAPLDDLELKMNRAAEAAVAQSKPIFLAAVRDLTISDGLALLRGGDGSATAFFRQRTEAQLSNMLRPQLETAMGQTGAFKAIDVAMERQPLLKNLAGDMRKDVVDYANRAALDALYRAMAQEETKLRTDPLARSSAILKRVFSGA
ncbi:MAG: DUF4197 domain-containing protein [Caulobacterales bacterium]|jgi:hypothetical protein